jgi:hypothetical protein
MARVVDGGVRYACGGCKGHLMGLAPFEREHPGDGRRLWVASDGGAEAGTCPFCNGHLRTPPIDGAPPGLGMCRRCEQVWVPAGADAGLPSAPAPTDAPPPRRHADECPECGAPWAPGPDGCCRYCRERLTAADPTVVIIERASADW